jgi:5-methylcytosine-specific restriction enzyme subunit McrC
MTTVTITEWTPHTINLDSEQAEALRRLHPRLDVRWDGPDTWTVTSAGVVGAARVAGLELVLRPRLPVARVLWLLGYALGAPFADGEAALAREPTLTDAFADMYLRSLRAAMRRGLQMGYQPREEALMTVRGRIRMTDQARRRFGLVVPAEVAYDDYTTDTDANRVLKAALQKIGQVPLRSPDLRRRVAVAKTTFASVSDVRFDPIQLPEFSHTRLDQHYRSPLVLANLILRSGGVDLKAGAVEVPALLFDMWRIFQDFLFEALRPLLPANHAWKAQAPLALDEDRKVRLLPDLSLWLDRRCVGIGDAKYKHTEQGEESDLYQLLAYCIATGLPTGTLIYADGPSHGIVHRVRYSGTRLEIVGLDLAAPQNEIEEALEDIAARFRDARLARAA